MVVKGSEEWLLFQDYFKLFSNYNESMTGDKVKDDATWDKYFIERDKFEKNYPTEFAQRLLVAFEDYLQAKQKGQPI